jgi:hypothetical protein
MAQKLKVNPKMAAEMLRQWEQDKDEWGRRKWTIGKLADAWGVGETTAYRVLNQLGPYQQLKKVAERAKMTTEEEDQEAKESLKKLLELQAKDQAEMRQGVLPEGPDWLEKMREGLKGQGGGAGTKRDIPPPPPMEELEDPETEGMEVPVLRIEEGKPNA